MDSLYIASYVAKQKAIAPAANSADAFYAQHRRGSTFAPLASAIGFVSAWAGLISLIPTA